MNWLYKLSQVIGIILIIAGAGAAVFAYLKPGMSSAGYMAGAILVVTGAIIFTVNTYFGRIFKDFPKTKGFGESMRDGAQRMSSAAEMLKEQNKMNRLGSEGVPIKVKIIGFKDTGTMINNDPVLEFQLEVLKEHRYDNYYINSHRQIVSKIILPRIQTGNEYPARLDPTDKNCVHISWM